MAGDVGATRSPDFRIRFISLCPGDLSTGTSMRKELQSRDYTKTLNGEQPR
jgi:hypothetical protein